MEEQTVSDAAVAGAVFAMIAFFVLIGLGLHVFLSYCFKRIAEKTGHDPGVLVWIPIVNHIPLFRAARLPGWLFFLLLIPVVNLVVFIILCVQLCVARGKSPWLAILALVPIPCLIFFPCLAFSK